MMSLVTNLIKATSDNQRPLGLYKARGPITQETIQRGKCTTSFTYILSGAKDCYISKASNGVFCMLFVYMCLSLPPSLSECVASISCCVVVHIYIGTAV